MNGGRDQGRKIQKLQEKLHIVSKILEHMKEGVVILDSRGRIKAVNRAFLKITGLGHDQLYGREIQDLDLKWEGFASFEELLRAMREKKTWQGEVWGVHRDGTVFTSEVSLVRADEEEGIYVALFLDTSDRRNLEDSLRSLSHYDPVTGLPNRALLYDHLSYTLFRAKGRDKLVGVVFFDIDNFKLINDTLGHDIGDKLLKAFSRRLASHFPSGTLVSRFGGDEFVVVLPLMDRVEDVEELVSSFVRGSTNPFYIDSQKIYVTVTAGISVFPMDGCDPQTLLRNADIAMHHAKELGKSSYRFFTDELNLKVTERFSLEAELRDALERDEFVLYYQPIFDLNENHIVCAEALLRWHHPDKGVILPGRFIEVAEEVDLITPIGEWVLRKACADGRKLHEEGFPLRIAINISANQLSVRGFPSLLKEVVLETGFDPRYLEVEITESALMKNKQEAAKILKELRDMGVYIAIDDFGTSYSSLNYLKFFPVNKLKIDRSFIGDIMSDPNDVAIATTIIAIAHNLGLKATAEGVETEEQLIFLKLWQCDEAQGFYFSPPVTMDRLLELLRSESFRIKDV